MWVAAYRSIYQPWSILSRRNSTSCCSLFCAASRKQRTLDGTINRKDCSSLVFCFHNCSDKLEKTGSYDALSPITRFFSFSNFCLHYAVLYLVKKNSGSGFLFNKSKLAIVSNEDLEALSLISTSACIWTTQATEAKERILGRSLLADNGLAWISKTINRK